MAKILIDTGVFVALFDKNDQYHQKAVDFIKNNKSPLVSSLACITETLFLLTHPTNRQNFLHWLHFAKIDLVCLGHADMTYLAYLMERYADVPMDFADACLVHIAQTQNLQHIATIDSDFRIYRINSNGIHYPFRIVI